MGYAGSENTCDLDLSINSRVKSNIQFNKDHKISQQYSPYQLRIDALREFSLTDTARRLGKYRTGMHRKTLRMTEISRNIPEWKVLSTQSGNYKKGSGFLSSPI